jgi:antibiotic biosynthesis monooxygenase (ABM) superfamily enzyme
MFILRLLIAALVVSYVIWLFYNRVMGKNLGLSKVATWVLAATFLIYLILSGLSYFVEGF